MKYSRFGDTYLLRIDLGEEIMQSLKAFCEQENVRLARVEAIGASDHAVIGVYDLEEKAYHREELDGFMEIVSLAGNITRMNGEAYLHLHGALADQNNVVHGGHVIERKVGATCEMFVTVPPGEVTRAADERLGINLSSL